MSDTTINTLKAALNSYRDAISAMTDDQWREIIDDLDFNPDTDSWPEWEDKYEEIRQEMDFIENLDEDDKAVYITLSYVDDNEFSKVTGITATDGSGNVLLDMDFIIPIDLDKEILEQIQEAV